MYSSGVPFTVVCFIKPMGVWFNTYALRVGTTCAQVWGWAGLKHAQVNLIVAAVACVPLPPMAPDDMGGGCDADRINRIKVNV